MQTHKGLYLGTEINGKWWKRCISHGLFMKGNGEWWLDAKGFYFRRYLTKNPIFIAFKEICGIRIGRWHSGKWPLGNAVVKVDWKKEGAMLSSGFVISSDPKDAIRLKGVLGRKIKAISNYR